MGKEFEIARLAIIRACKAGEIDEGRGYAWSRRIFPLNPRDLEFAFAEDFTIGQEKRDEVYQIIDEGWRKNKLVKFYDLEGLGGSGIKLDRMDLVAVCRLAHIGDLFDDALYKALVAPGSGPIESQGLANPFSMEDDIG
ncbi:hypothetical protein [Bradyrhizobium valentinum]|uniref:Uncharacterized protein n=1 Tax=Bradyrhizobium valentinum TaxID=1518501 RepID=A0A0R3M4J6_9BRAD|nr:hypothetical protein [Bradyrhizobium valentinum]KRR14938.1 hypothetical protein CP49_41280 [Bradyrhizobium valentinum]